MRRNQSDAPRNWPCRRRRHDNAIPKLTILLVTLPLACLLLNSSCRGTGWTVDALMMSWSRRPSCLKVQGRLSGVWTNDKIPRNGKSLPTNGGKQDLTRQTPSSGYPVTTSKNRRELLAQVPPLASLLLTSSGAPSPALASDTSSALPPPLSASPASSLGNRLLQKDPQLLKNKIFNIPPKAMVYPSWMAGKWSVTSSFVGYVFPSQTISKQRIVQNTGIAGFQKCSIASLCDVGKEGPVTYDFVINPDTRQEDRIVNFPNQINAFLGYTAVIPNDNPQQSQQSVVYKGDANPNRISIDFIDYKTTNAERIELFCNARESQEYTATNADSSTSRIFCAAEYFRQVTFGTGNTPGIARQAVTTYAHFWTWKWNNVNTDDKTDMPPQLLTGNVLTAAYLDPQDAMYFEEPQNPVAIYSHSLTAKRIS